MEERPHIHVAGAGLVGSLISVMLGQRGYRVTLLERRPDMRREASVAGRSINLALSSRGIKALKKAGLFEDVSSLLIPMRGRQLHFADGREEFMPYGQRPEEVIYSVSRRDLNALMMTRAEEAEPVNIRFEQKLESIDFERRELIIRDLATDEIRGEPFTTLLGADGAGSRTRRAMLPSSGGQSQSEFLDHDYKELEIPAASGSSLESPRFQIEPQALHIWPRGEFMLIALPNQDGSFTVTLFLPRTGPHSFQSLDQPGSLIPFFEQYFPDALELIPDLAQDYAQHPQGRLGTLRCDQWYHEDQVLLMGDASHAIVPFHGQGMNCGFEDCDELIRLLEQYQDQWNLVMPEFQRVRKPNADAIADMAIENYITMRSSVRDPDFQLKKELGFELERRYPNRFVPRYSLVMFHEVPYAEAQQRGLIQQRLLDELVAGRTTLKAVDWERADELVQQRLTPIVGLGPA